jgi:regulator of protease activity HflC (stomatin/prohibitin superfamily)
MKLPIHLFDDQKPVNRVSLLILLAGAGILWGLYSKKNLAHEILGILAFTTLTLAASFRMAEQWERAVVLRLGRFKSLRGPGLFMVIPFIDTVYKYIDQRIRVTDFQAEQTLTSDTVPVNVDAVVYWMVWDAEKAALEVQSYKEAVTYIAQTGLRDTIGKHNLADLLQNRHKIAATLQENLDEITTPWGITCQHVGIKDIIIPEALSNAMSKQAQAERERQARVILGTAETEIARNFAEASLQYQNNPVALQLRGMNMLFEGLKEKGSMVIVPSSALDSMNMGALSGLVALGKQGIQDSASGKRADQTAQTERMDHQKK